MSPTYLTTTEIQEIVTLNKAKGVDVLAAIKNSFESLGVLYVFTGSAVRMMMFDIFGPYSPLFGRVTQTPTKLTLASSGFARKSRSLKMSVASRTNMASIFLVKRI